MLKSTTEKTLKPALQSIEFEHQVLLITVTNDCKETCFVTKLAI